jgi:hypothetical protein
VAFRDSDRWLKQKWTIPVLIFMLLPWAGLLWTNDNAEGLNFAKKATTVFMPLPLHQ